MLPKNMGNLYGLDIKLTEANGHIVPVGIEINGIDFGTNFFCYGEGHSYYRNFARVLSAASKGKPIFIQGDGFIEQSNVSKAYEAGRIEKEREITKRRMQRYGHFFDGFFGFDSSWVDDLCDFNLEKLKASGTEAEEPYYALAAQKERIPLFVFRDVQYGHNKLDFLLENGSTITVKPDDIGVIRNSARGLSDVPQRFQKLFLNSPFIETVLDSKPLFYYLGEFDPNLRNLFAPSIPYGVGINSAQSVISYFDAINPELIVKKRGNSYCGTGVEIINWDNFRRNLETKLSESTTVPEMLAMATIMSRMFRVIKLENLVSMYEQFIPSIPIFDTRTGMQHDGCARVVVYSDGKSPIVLGSQWRLATKSLSEVGATLEDRFRVNLSRGAREMQIDAEHEGLINRFAVQAITEFETAVQEYRTSTEKRIIDVLRQEYPDVSVSDALRYAFLDYYLGLNVMNLMGRESLPIDDEQITNFNHELQLSLERLREGTKVGRTIII